MKINGPNQFNFNPYKKPYHKQMDVKQEMKNDQIEISNRAKQLQQEEKPSPQRAEKVERLKEVVASGEYEINYEKTAQKMLDFWRGK
ncbi:flagellar biosynthesis anti-sigma factor FlgM [Virgibacillus proomii]|uniref:flagellar biosynthesis anti-sigma factor FlgM n=1 Tax=Virgibacillus proomii TaxID=84407 RepID=UPI0009841547|nr:flagellar biosynthesis anti-sigma factor FlgM [Virgibacillus proomii]